ncbi:uncharacterized protein LOC122645522 [Telopea speciosissima]|uniref:uncharacterized protein LOC122645522 n=1 Tax=Telopea speciosissima TaxID=54955 RepID=UPI001CC35F71|nr:uncharacterized protein LOC122645522 [Telopea speciosissima]
MFPVEGTGRSLFEVVEENLSVRYSREQILSKLQYFLEWYTKVKDSRASVVNSHDQILFEIAHKVWGIEENPHEAVVAGNDERPLTLNGVEMPLGSGLKLGFMGLGSYHMEVMTKEDMEKFEGMKVMEKKEKWGLLEEREFEIFLEGLGLSDETLELIKKAVCDKYNRV